MKELLTRLVPLLERFIKAFFRVRGQVEVLEHIHGYLFLIGFISCPLDMGLQIHQKVVPAAHIVFIARQIRDVKPLFDPDFGTVGLFTFFRLKKVGKRTILIQSSKRKEPAEAGTECVNPASALPGQKRAAVPFSRSSSDAGE